MKKKLLISLGIIATLMFVACFGYVCLFKKTPISPDEYIKVLDETGIKVEDESWKINKELKNIIIKSFYYSGYECETQFAVLNNNITAQNMINKAYENVKNNLGNQKVYSKNGITIKQTSIKEKNSKYLSNKHYLYRSTHIDNDNYFVWVRVENTVLYFGTFNSNQKIVDGIVKKLNYNPNGLTTTLLLYTIASILSLIITLCCLYIIFKKHNIHPLLAIVPFVNVYYLCKIADKSGWKMLFFLIPFFNFVYYFILMYKLARQYTASKLICFGIGFIPLVLLPGIAFNEPEVKENKNIYEEILDEYDNK